MDTAPRRSRGSDPVQKCVCLQVRPASRRDGQGSRSALTPTALSGAREARAPVSKEPKNKQAAKTTRHGGTESSTTTSTAIAIPASHVAEQPIAGCESTSTSESSSTTPSLIAESSVSASSAKVSRAAPETKIPGRLPVLRPPAKPSQAVIHSAPGEGTRARKRQRREEALGWGLETVSPVPFSCSSSRICTHLSRIYRFDRKMAVRTNRSQTSSRPLGLRLRPRLHYRRSAPPSSRS